MQPDKTKHRISIIKKKEGEAWKAANAVSALQSLDPWQARYQRPKGWIGKRKWD